MKEPQILSVFDDTAAALAGNAAPRPVALVFDACHVGVVLRAKGKEPAATTAHLAELQAHIRPHFLFNTLNSAIALLHDVQAGFQCCLKDGVFRVRIEVPA